MDDLYMQPINQKQNTLMHMDLITHIMQSREEGANTAWQVKLPISHHKLESVSWYQLLNIHCGELLPQLLLMNLSQERGGRQSWICPLCCEQSLGILGLLSPICEHKLFYMSTIRGTTD